MHEPIVVKAKLPLPAATNKIPKSIITIPISIFTPSISLKGLFITFHPDNLRKKDNLLSDYFLFLLPEGRNFLFEIF